MALRNPGRLAIHRRSDEIAFLQHLLRALDITPGDRQESNCDEPTAYGEQEGDLRCEVRVRQRALADELLHTRQTEPLAEALQRRLIMAELIYRDLGPPVQGERTDGHRVAEIERRALGELLQQWWAWLRES